MYEFTKDCLTGVQTIDDEHKKLFDLLNDAISKTQSADDVYEIADNLLNGLRDYVSIHFSHEELYMEEIHDPELPIQKAAHAAFSSKIQTFSLPADQPDKAREALNELLLYLIRWLYRHILSSDILIGTSTAKELENEDPFIFSDKYRTGITLIDDEHKRLFEIINDVNELIHAEYLHDKYDEIMRLLEELKDYTEFHFSDEENYMKKINYAGFDAQKRAHTAFIERLIEIDLSDLDAMDQNQQTYLDELINFLLDWLINHIMKMDKLIGH